MAMNHENGFGSETVIQWMVKTTIRPFVSIATFTRSEYVRTFVFQFHKKGIFHELVLFSEASNKVEIFGDYL